MKAALVIDKGTADAIACSGGEAVISLAKAVQRCLDRDGVWISLSFSALRYELEGLPLEVEVISKILTPKRLQFDPDIYHYCYSLKSSKGDGGSVQELNEVVEK